MAAPPDFIAGATLTALQMNQIGLWKIKTISVGFGVSSVTVSDAFSADYDSYLIVDSGGTSTVDAAYRLTLGASATGYYSSLIYGSFLGGPVTNASGNNLAYVEFAGGSATRNGYIELQSPFAVNNTEIRARVRYGTVYGTTVALHGVPTSFSSFTLTASAGTFSGGTIHVYGYRK
jgi:hypothetical protein